MVGGAHVGAAAVNVTSINLAGNTQKKVQSTDDILRQIESTLPNANQEDKYRQEELSARILGRISQHEAAFGDKALPRSRLPKVDANMLDRYQAARRNVLVLGAIKQASRPNTHRSGKSSNAPSVAAAAVGDGSSLDGDDATVRVGLESNFTSFNGSRTDAGSPTRMARDAGDISAEPSGYAGTELSISSRRMRHQSSGRSAASSFAGSMYSSTAASRLRQQGSSISTGSGQTLRSEGSRYSHHHYGKKTPRRHKPPKPKPGRVTTAMAEHGSRDDWMSKTLLKHYLASVIQARWRGYQLRKRWAQPEGWQQVVEEEKAKNEAPELHQQRLRELQHKLIARQQKQLSQATAAAVAAAAEGDGEAAAAGTGTGATAGAATAAAGVASAAGGRGVSAGRRPPGSRVFSAVAGNNPAKLKYWQSVKFAGASESYQPEWSESDSDSGWSDIELEDVASIKFRAVTPPWQKVGEQCCMSKQLRQRTAAAAAAATGKPMPEGLGVPDELGGMLGVLWDNSSSECNARLQELRHRRICRKPEPVALSEPAVAAAAAAGLLATPAAADGSAGAAAAAAGPAGGLEGAEAYPLPTQVVEQLLLERYSAKYNRLGVPEKMPGRTKWLKQQEAAKAAAAAHAAASSAAAQMGDASGSPAAAVAAVDAPGAGVHAESDVPAPAIKV